MKKGIQATRGITLEKDQLENTITLANVARRLRIKNLYGRAAGKKACGGIAKIRSSRIHSKSCSGQYFSTVMPVSGLSDSISAPGLNPN